MTHTHRDLNGWPCQCPDEPTDWLTVAVYSVYLVLALGALAFCFAVLR